MLRLVSSLSIDLFFYCNSLMLFYLSLSFFMYFYYSSVKNYLICLIYFYLSFSKLCNWYLSYSISCVKVLIFLFLSSKISSTSILNLSWNYLDSAILKWVYFVGERGSIDVFWIYIFYFDNRSSSRSCFNSLIYSYFCLTVDSYSAF